MAAAREAGVMRIPGPVRFERDGGREVAGVVMYVPIYRFGTPATQSARRAALQGWVHAPLDLHEFVDAALRTTQRHAALTIRDDTGGGAGNAQVLYADHPELAGKGDDGLTRTMPLELYGRRWELEFNASARAALAARAPELRTTLGTGVLASLLLFGIALVLARTESLAERKAAMLAESYQRSELRFRNAMRFSAIGQALLDRRGTIVDANPALAALLETPTDAPAAPALGPHVGDAPRVLPAQRAALPQRDAVFGHRPGLAGPQGHDRRRQPGAGRDLRDHDRCAGGFGVRLALRRCPRPPAAQPRVRGRRRRRVPHDAAVARALG